MVSENLDGNKYLGNFERFCCYLKGGDFSDQHGIEAGLPGLQLELLPDDQLHRFVPRPAVVQNFVTLIFLVQRLRHEVKVHTGARW